MILLFMSWNIRRVLSGKEVIELVDSNIDKTSHLEKPEIKRFKRNIICCDPSYSAILTAGRQGCNNWHPIVVSRREDESTLYFPGH